MKPKNQRSGQLAIDLFAYTNYRDYLKDYYFLQKKTTRFFSYRYFAGKAGFASHNVLKMIMNGDRNLAGDSIGKVSQALNHSVQEAEYFRLLVLLNQSKRDEEKRRIFVQMLPFRHSKSAKRINELQYGFYGQWFYPALRELVTLADFVENPVLIARRLAGSTDSNPVTPGHVKKAIDAMLEMGILQRDSNGKLVQSDALIKTDTEVDFIQARQHLREMIDRSKGALDCVPRTHREISTMTVGISPAKIAQIKKMIQDFKDHILDFVEQDTDHSEHVYQLNVQFFPLTRNCDKGEQS